MRGLAFVKAGGAFRERPDVRVDKRKEDYLVEARKPGSPEARDQWLKIADGYRVLARYTN